MQPPGPAWFQAPDGRWYPVRPGMPPGAPPPRRGGNRGCLVAVLVTVTLLLVGGGVAVYFAVQAARGVAGLAEDAGVLPGGESRCPSAAEVSQVLGSAVTEAADVSVVVAAGCTYLGTDRAAGLDVQITIGSGLIADEVFEDFRGEGAAAGAPVEPVPVGERGLAFSSEVKSAAIGHDGGRVVQVDITAAGTAPIGDRRQAAVTLLEAVLR